ncbi:TPA: N-acetyltransferase [Klebsiella pneumoniae]|uniref:Acetyltransferase n=1 Tax=Klebsiella pneumoniae TaxID=573 RepID=W9B2N9_KLEPN|nr:N-acetyltransferase [Klebsiella pneumoniae]AIX71537.1 acetyltransferase [Klebsiella pneumoniae subsp. pneumoniae]EPF28798.1 acetyltransferase YhhY [Klebsiella pneumoniae subsp. pneumoniae CIP 52.145 = B5055]EWF39323.1 acetyltransferase [Klebsiella pneumoniae BWH 15]EIW9266491.1 N-acetyltransferase [Klebsiella pneumoniae]EIW9288637.1 N-acetyltransferase [Klebsiella pneumoniae]
MSDIVIRHAEPRDAEPLRMLMAHPEVYHDTLQIPYPSMEAWQEKLQPRPHTFHLVATLDEQVAGHLSLHVEPRPRRSHVATFGMAVAAGHQGCGIGSALMREMIDLCDNWLRVERIELTVFADNAPAIAVYKKYGFEIEGTGRRYALRNGEYVDAYYMARIK